jgi:Type ISP C-terminal specificity domain
MLGGSNLGLIATRQTKDEWGVLATRDVCGHKTCGAYDINFLFPLELQADTAGLGLASTRPNISSDVVNRVLSRLGSARSPSPVEFFHYCYAVFYSPAYRGRYEEFLKTGFPRVPSPANGDVFDVLGRLGAELVSLHLLEYEQGDRRLAEYRGPEDPFVGQVSWSNGTVWLDTSNKAARGSDAAHLAAFEGVPEAAWLFRVGGYRPCEKWLKDRKGRKLSLDDIDHYNRVVFAITETIRLMGAIDTAINAFGGWPAAFHA